MENNFYVYIWFLKETNEVFYVGKGKNNRYKSLSSRNSYFLNIIHKYDVVDKIILETYNPKFNKHQYLNEYKIIKNKLSVSTIPDECKEVE